MGKAPKTSKASKVSKNLDLDPNTPTDVRGLCENDPRFVPVVRQFGFPSPSPTADEPPVGKSVYESLAMSIIYQQLSGKAAKTILGRFCQIQPGVEFPTPSYVVSANESVLRACGLSQRKAEYLKSLAQKCGDGSVPLDLKDYSSMTDDQIIETLTSIKGIGVWSAQMFMIFSLKRPDVMPSGDLGIRKGCTAFLKDPVLIKPEKLLEESARWSPYRSLATWYFWRIADDLKPKDIKGNKSK
eukprot:TRINITY_DN11581_c0_g1_i1.p1 TRINITY_DN11581_c0_g1~~TRINITY_DN11581_c0_g1_i1.p1  ORF type:complete len:242 (+),score=44.49 TRINITY_DN11581_c0_g1_i1:45-770(+)